MVHRITIVAMGAAALAAAILPRAASAADYYDGGGQRPLAFHTRDDVEIDGDRARIAHRQDLRQDLRQQPRRYGAPSYGAPVVAFDERDPDRRYDRPAYGYGPPADGYRRPAFIERPADGYGPPPFDARFPRPDAPVYGFGDPSPYRAASAYRDGPAPVGFGYDERAGSPDVGCTVEEAQSTTPAGWRKVVTHRTCYRR